ncbi:MAG: TIM-barrel domain-containing protein [Prevotella sp.]
MKKLFTLMSFLLISLLVSAADTNTFEFVTGASRVRVVFYTPQIVRITKTPAAASMSDKASEVVIMSPRNDFSARLTETQQKAVMQTTALTVALDKRTSLVTFAAKGKTLLREKATAFDVRQRGSDKGRYEVTITYTLDKNEAIYGLGTVQDGRLNRRGLTKTVEQSNLEDFQNVIQSVKGWGIYWDNYSRAHFQDNAGGMTFKAEVGDDADYYFMYGQNADGVNRCMRQLTGDVPMFPLWTYGYWQCRERYKSSRELLEVVDKYRELKVPLDGIIQDWQYWGSNYTWNAMDFIGETFTDGKAMIDRVHKQNAHIMISIWASFGPQTIQYRELSEKGLLFDFETWPQSGLAHLWPPRMDYPSGVKVYDAFSPVARQIYWNHLKRLYDYGIDAWWMDSTDPDFFNPKEKDYDQRGAMGSWRSMRNLFPLATVKGIYKNQREVSADKRVFIMTRSAFAGQQHYGSGLWSGDVASSWDMLRKQVPAGLNYTMTGCPNFNTDIGGFFCGAYNTQGSGSAPRNPQYQELYVRWMQYGLFCPVFRSHGADAPREIYQFGKKGEPVYDAIEETIRLRYRLIPYLYSTAWQVTSAGDSYLRSLTYDFAADTRTWDMADEFMCGRSILATPVLSPQYTEEKIMKEDAMSGWDKQKTDGDVQNTGASINFTEEKTITKYLPKGAGWYDFNTEQYYRGGRDVTVRTSLDRVPMFVRAGSVLPLAPVMQYAEERAWDNLEIVVYPGDNGTFTLYEDEGDNYNYEKGIYSTITMTWNDKSRTLTIEPRKGEYPGMLQSRVFNIRLAGKKNVVNVTYNGDKTEVRM